MPNMCIASYNLVLLKGIFRFMTIISQGHININEKLQDFSVLTKMHNAFRENTSLLINFALYKGITLL